MGLAEDNEHETIRSPLEELYQLDGVEDSTLNREAVVLIMRLLENVEEFYELQTQIMDVMVVDDEAETRMLDLLQTLIQGLRAEQSFMRRVNIFP